MDLLPIFVEIAGQPVMVLGTGEPAAAKARLVLAAGGHVVGEDSPDARLAFVAIEDRALAAAAAQRLRARGLLVNVVDRPGMSDFLMGSIIDRAPVLIAVSTRGASAGLARALRERLEALLPAQLGRLASAIRGARVAAAIRHGDVGARRRLWARALASGGPLDPLVAQADLQAAMATALAGASDSRDALVVIEIGSDDPGDLTLNQMAALSRCDTLLVEGQVAPAIVDRARRDAVRLEALPDTWPEGLSVVLRLAGEGPRQGRG